MNKKEIHKYFSEMAKKSKESQIKKYGGKEGYSKEMKRRGGIRKKK